jgi:hypothetical protein
MWSGVRLHVIASPARRRVPTITRAANAEDEGSFREASRPEKRTGRQRNPESSAASEGSNSRRLERKTARAVVIEVGTADKRAGR